MIHQLPHGQIIRARVETVYPTIAGGSVTLIISDGPYGLSLAEWDKVKDLAAFYRPHIAEWSRVCAPSASVYLWATAEGWATIHHEMVAAGWTFRALIVWDKRTPASMLGWRSVRTWPDQIEVCGFYQRGAAPFALAGCLGNVWEYSTKALAIERLRGAERVAHRGLEGDVYPPVHICEKPLLFATRMIEASTRPGNLILAPFGGTCREAVACETLAAHWPEKARRYIVAEQDEDGRDYIAAAIHQIRTGGTKMPTASTQATLFHGAP